MIGVDIGVGILNFYVDSLPLCVGRLLERRVVLGTGLSVLYTQRIAVLIAECIKNAFWVTVELIARIVVLHAFGRLINEFGNLIIILHTHSEGRVSSPDFPNQIFS